jgi:hypothetical protein
LSASRPGQFSVSAGWSEIPATFADQSLTIHRLSGENTLLIPNSVQRQLQANASGLMKYVKHNAAPVELQTTWETTRAAASFSPMKGLLLSVSGEDSIREGTGSRSVSTNFFNGADVTEWPNPLSDRTRTGIVQLTYNQGPAMVSMNASASQYSEQIDPLYVDNPLRATDAEGQFFGNRSATQFLISQPLDNQAKQIGVSASLDLPLRMRLAGSYSEGSIEAAHDFLPYTSNTAVRADFFYPALPAQTYEGDIATSSYSFAFTGRPVKLFSFNVYARGYGYDNRTPAYVFPAYVVADTRVQVVPRVALPYGWSRDGIGVDGKLQALSNLSFTLGYEHESIDHTFREVDHSDENTVRLASVWEPGPWLLLRASVAGSERTGDDYNPDAYVESYPGGVPGDQKEFALIRRYDVADRKSNQADLSAVFTFGDRFGFDYTAAYQYDDYNASSYGLVDDQTRNHVVGMWFVPFRPCQARFERGTNFFTYRMNARYRNLLFGQPADAKANDWSDEITERNETWLVDFVCRADDESWDFDFHAATSSDRQSDDASYHAHTYVDPEHIGKAHDYPPTERQFRQTRFGARFRLSRVFDVLLRAMFEQYDQEDRSEDVMAPTMSRYDSRSFESAYMGVREGTYSATVLNVLLGARW